MPAAVRRRGGSTSLRVASRMEPFKQGSCDALCGLYAILNALTLVLSPRYVIAYADARTLFQAGLALLEERGALLDALRDGVPVPLWHAVAERLCAAASVLASVPLTLERPFEHRLPSTPQAFARIEELIDDGHAVLISLDGALSHYSVICGYAPASFRLFDSNGLSRLRRSTCATGRDRHATLHWLDLRAMLVVHAGQRTRPEAQS